MVCGALPHVEGCPCGPPDPTGALTKALDLELVHPGPVSVLGNTRCKRFALVVDKGTVTYVGVSESPDDPTGDGDISLSNAEGVLKAIKSM